MMGSAAGRFARSALAIIGTLHTTAAVAQVRRFNVPAGPATASISEFGRQAGVQVLASERAVSGRRTAAVRGAMTVRDGLERLLLGTGLQGVSLDSRTFTLMVQPARSTMKPALEAAVPEPVSSVIMVTGFRSSLSLALGLKRRESASVDTILAEDIGKFPDANLAESMQRLPGISLTRGDGGEGRNVTVRGLSAEFTRVRINGMEAASQTGSSDAYGGSNSSRSFDFNVFPSELFSSLKVNKTTTWCHHIRLISRRISSSAAPLAPVITAWLGGRTRVFGG
jgi:iron complex outermembrane receptor protein